MPYKYPSASTRSTKKTLAALLLAAACALPLACGDSDGSSTESGALEIDSAEWRMEPEPRVVVNGEWSVGTSTPPICELLEGESGEPSSWHDKDPRIELDGPSFRQEFTRAPDSAGSTTLDPETEYYARCRVNGLTGNSLEAVSPVEGEVPAS